MKIDSFCFKFLVVDWTACWKGCKTEQEWIDKEYEIFDEVPPSSREGRSSTAAESHDERAIESSDSSKPASENLSGDRKRVPPPLAQANADGNHSMASISTATSTTASTHGTETPRRTTGAVEQLAPIQPLSPMNF